MASAIHLRSAVALTGRFPVLAGVDLDLDEGSVLVVLGANGAGKTSLLRLLAGLLALQSGTGEILGCDLSSHSRHVRRRVGLLGHDVGLYDELRPLENLTFALRAGRLDPALAAPALERTGITGRVAETPLGQLSAGQRRRVGLALLIARRPRLWLLDEPHASLDAPTRELVGELVEEAARAGATVVATSHEPELSVPMADLVATMAGGMIARMDLGGRQVFEGGD
ncbi:MAG: heme ABC exporter ATP-binding protein CcmA [Actinomycetes bacterium]